MSRNILSVIIYGRERVGEVRWVRGGEVKAVLLPDVEHGVRHAFGESVGQ